VAGAALAEQSQQLPGADGLDPAEHELAVVVAERQQIAGRIELASRPVRIELYRRVGPQVRDRGRPDRSARRQPPARRPS
jgi:hypothetical protein